ncbi:MAG: N-6 DNA methylase [Leptospirales bacterium]
MASEELLKRGYLATGFLKGDPFGEFEDFNLGDTHLADLISAGISAVIPAKIDFLFKLYKVPKKPPSAKPDRLIVLRDKKKLKPVAVAEYKRPAKMKTADMLTQTAEQGLYSAIALDAPIAIATDGVREFYVNVHESITQGQIYYFDEKRSLNPAVIKDLLSGGGIMRDPAPLAKKVWQLIWHATKDEPKACLLTFIEIFVLKFLSDNLPSSVLPKTLSFYELIIDPADFLRKHGVTAIEHYVTHIRPHIKQIFPDNTVCADASIGNLFGLTTVVSKTSIINGFSFLRNSSSTSTVTYNRVFLEILNEFHKFGTLTEIDPEFKLRLYETFLKESARQQKLGQFFTPRNVVRPMIRMAQLGKLPEGSVVFDPACGVGGFVLEPMLVEASLKNTISFVAGKPKRKLKTVGIDVDANTHILAKANLLIHMAEAVRDPATTQAALNALMAETFVLMNGNETLGALEYPAINNVDVILTNPPYVTQGSGIYKKEISTVSGTRNGKVLRDYYDGVGLGVESLFLRYISGALKPGGRAFVIVPQGLLTRTEVGSKRLVLGECNLLASIALPRNTFFNTPQKTYILALEKRHTSVDPRPPVFCAIVRSIGETLDYRRLSTPNDNDLDIVSTEFIRHVNSETIENHKFIKIIAADELLEEDRWDSARFWTNEELVELGTLEPAITRDDFIEELLGNIAVLKKDLTSARTKLSELTDVPSKRILISDGDINPATGTHSPYFEVRRGHRVTRKDCDCNPGQIPVYSGSKDPYRPLGMVSEEWLKQNGIPIEKESIVTVNANGYVGAVFVRRERCVIHDDVMIIMPLREDIDLDYLAIQLRGAITEGNFEYEAKLYSRVKELGITIPSSPDGFDLKQQKKIGSAIKQFNLLRSKIEELGIWGRDARIKESDNEDGS